MFEASGKEAIGATREFIGDDEFQELEAILSDRADHDIALLLDLAGTDARGAQVGFGIGRSFRGHT